MANALDADLRNRVVIIGAQYLAERLAAPALRAFRVEDGFGSAPYTSGHAIMGEFLFDGERCRMEGWMVERFATDAEIADAETIRTGEARPLRREEANNE